MSKRNALGRGLNALITMDDTDTQGSSFISEVELSKISPNPDQPRRQFDDEAMEELAASIARIGIIQPITLRQIADDNYQIIAGERRFRAAKIAKLSSIPAYIKKVEQDDDVMQMALVENIQREDLNSIEIALAYQNLIQSLSLTQEQLSERVGKKRTTITNYLRLLKLPAEVQMGIKDKKIDMGHARALITLDDPEMQLSLYDVILTQSLSVRGVEHIVRELANGKSLKEILLATSTSTRKKTRRDTQPAVPQSGDFEALQVHLSNFFQTNVQFSHTRKGNGRITIPFQSTEELERIISILDQSKK